ncbi:ArsR/SmtB family transcription factor [Streptomyces sp. NPDC014995]|uniref:ArsR/SmtB family transcription factor n=1 Tax=Streptomyces sp. NPDC014995 TaxID=3364936 RepID=UPI0036F5595F
MTLRIHFTQDDLLRVSLAPGTDPLHETVMSLRVLQQRRPGMALGAWRRWARSRVPHSVHRLRSLVPPEGMCPDFLTPTGTVDFEAGLDELLHTPASFLRTDLEAFTHWTGKPLPPWAVPLTDGSPQALRSVSGALRDWHRTAIAPLRPHVDARVEAARLSAARTLLAEGLDALLSRLHPAISWKPPVLELTCAGHDRDLSLDGRGLRLVPSFFSGSDPMVHLDPGLPPVVIYPVTHDTVWTPDTAAETGQGRLAALVGHSRAIVLDTIAAGHGVTTTELARRTGIAPATVSHHTTVLREAGLISTHRTGSSAHHLPTPLGVRLVAGERPPSPL